MTSRLSLPNPRLAAAVVAAKSTALAIRFARRGGGTSAPGLVAERIDPAVLTNLARGLDRGAIVVAGTNGKTTTSRMVAGILTAGGRRVIHNRSGSNLVQGVISALAAQSSLGGAPRGDIAVIETDEAAFPEVVRLVQPRVILLNNLFRDQLDRYGEIDTVARIWSRALGTVSPETAVIFNADDPGLTRVVDGLGCRVVPFGLTERTHTLDALPHAVDSRVCFRCGGNLAYHALYVSHLGDWHCVLCENARPRLAVNGHEIALEGVNSLAITIDRGPESSRYVVQSPGVYNAYNVLAAVAVARELGISEQAVQTALAMYRPAFGRNEQVTYRGRRLTLALVKNPVGFNEVLRMLTRETGGLNLPTLIAINDLDADGRDVSWLWDVDFELLASGDGVLSTTGLRGPDMTNRLKYAGVVEPRIRALPEDLEAGLDQFVDSVPDGAQAYILPTYTAMLGIRDVLAKRGAVKDFWNQ